MSSIITARVTRACVLWVLVCLTYGCAKKEASSAGESTRSAKPTRLPPEHPAKKPCQLKGRWLARPVVNLPPRVPRGGLVFAPRPNGEFRVMGWGHWTSSEGRAVVRPDGCDLTLHSADGRRTKYRCRIARPEDELGKPAPFCSGYCDNGERQGIGTQRNPRFLGFSIDGPLLPSGSLADDFNDHLYRIPESLLHSVKDDTTQPSSDPPRPTRSPTRTAP